MLDIDKAKVLLMVAALDPDFLPQPPSNSLLEQAHELDLVIEIMNWMSGMYFGPVVGQDDQAWLFKIGSGRAGILSFTEIEEDAVIPRLGDKILLTLTHGIAHVVVLPSAENASTDAERFE